MTDRLLSCLDQFLVAQSGIQILLIIISFINVLRDYIRSYSNCSTPHRMIPSPRARTVPYLESEDHLLQTAWDCRCQHLAIWTPTSAGQWHIGPELLTGMLLIRSATAHADEMHPSRL